MDENDVQQQEQENGMCVACHLHVIDRNTSQYSELCETCREHYLKLHVPRWVILFLLVIALAVVATATKLPVVIDNYKIYNHARQAESEHRYLTALKDYIEILTKYSDAKDIAIKAIDIAIKSQQFDTAVDILNNYLVGKDVSDTQYNNIMSATALMDKYFETSDKCYAIFNEAETTEDAEQELHVLLLESDSKIDKNLVYYLLSGISQDSDRALEYLRQASGDDWQITIYRAYYGNIQRRNGDIEGAKDTYLLALQLFAEDAASIRGLGILDLLNGQREEGLSSILSAYDLMPDALYAAEAVIITLCENNRRDEALTFYDERVSEGYEFDSELNDYLNGTLSLQGYYGTDGE